MTTAANLIEGALRALQRIGVNETPTNEAYAVGLSTLNMMLDTFAARGLFVYETTEKQHTLTVGTNEYTIGSGGDIDTNRPIKIDNAIIRDGDDYDYTFENVNLSEDEYISIASKSSSGRPRYLFYKPSYSLGKVYLWPTPDATDTLVLYLVNPFSAFSSTGATVSMPNGYQEALKYNLAVRLAPEYGVSAPPEVVAFAISSMRTIENLNAYYRITPVHLDLPGTYQGHYNINSDSYN